MSPKRWILLLVFYISYLMFGASIYYHIEHGEERHRRNQQLKERFEINEYLLEQLGDLNNTTKDEVLDRITDYCGKSVLAIHKDSYETPFIWTFYHSFFFAFTVCSTVGYGNISPSTDVGRMIMIVYSVIGIPVNGILFAGLGDYFGKTFQAIYRRYKKYKMSTNVRYVPPQLGLITIILIALVPGIALFLLLPAWIFSYFEGWSYLISFYYSYVTTTTIGFGDYVPTFQPDQPRKFGGWFVVYQIFIIVWFIFSLGYLLMIMTFITRGLQSKKLAFLEQQLSTNIKATQNRIWTGVTKDVGYMRRILNELYILKVKPVYTEPDFSHLLHRSVSCPEFSMYRVEPLSAFSRKRAFSESYDVVEARNFVHASSDTELDKLDKEKSFENAEAFRQTTELLSKVVNALATVKPPMQEEDTTIGSAGMYGGYHGFSDSQILASEWSFSTVNEPPPPPRRGRACSDFNVNPKWQMRRAASNQNEWTWSGDNDQIQEAINHRFKQNGRDQLYRASFGQRPQDHVVQVDDSEFKKPRSKKFSMPDGFRRLFPLKKRSSQDLNSAAASRDRKYSVMSVPETQIGRAAAMPPPPPLDYYSTVTANVGPSYFRNGKPKSVPASAFPSDITLASRRSGTANGAADLTITAATAAAYQRNAPNAARKRRESIFTQNPALATRRATAVFPSAAGNAAAALSQRRGSLFTTDRAAAGGAAMGAAGARRGSLFTTQLPSNKRRSSLFSVTSDQDLDVLESTTLADLIRALETVHTQAMMDEANANDPAPKYSALEAVFGEKKRKVGTAGLNAPELPSILSLFAGDNTKALTTTAANRLYARRATIVGTPMVMNSHQSSTSSLANVLTRRRPSAVVQIAQPPPSYTEKDTLAAPAPAAVQSTSVASKFKRRFSIRPTALQIPPGKAPPPGVNINSLVQPQTGAAAASSSSNAGTASSSLSALQRRLSLRPSPLARELNTAALSVRSADAATSDISPTSPTSTTAMPPSSSTRLLPLPARPSNTSSSTHSPLSRIVQISQAQRKSSMPDMLDRTKKPDPK